MGACAYRSGMHAGEEAPRGIRLMASKRTGHVSSMLRERKRTEKCTRKTPAGVYNRKPPNQRIFMHTSETHASWTHILPPMEHRVRWRTLRTACSATANAAEHWKWHESELQVGEELRQRRQLVSQDQGRSKHRSLVRCPKRAGERRSHAAPYHYHRHGFLVRASHAWPASDVLAIPLDLKVAEPQSQFFSHPSELSFHVLQGGTSL